MKKHLGRIAASLAVVVPLVGIGGVGAASAGTYVLATSGLSSYSCHYAGDAGVRAGVYSKFFCNNTFPSRAKGYDLYVQYR